MNVITNEELEQLKLKVQGADPNSSILLNVGVVCALIGLLQSMEKECEKIFSSLALVYH